MADTKKEHFVPRCYLANFASPSLKINLFDKWKVESRANQDIRNIAMENAFYDLDLLKLLETIDTKDLEKIQEDLKAIAGTDNWDEVKAIIGNKKFVEKNFFARIEGMYAPLLESVIRKSYNGNAWAIRNCKCMSESEKVWLSLFISIQYIRTRRFRDTLSDMISGTAQTLAYKAQLDCEESLPKDAFAVKMDSDFIKLQHSLMILDPTLSQHIAEILVNHIWVMGVNKTDIPFYTSDDPVIKIAHKKDDGFVSYAGFASEAIEIAFPISPNLLLCIYDPKVYGSVFSDLQFFEIRDPENVKYYNWHQLHDCYRYVFSNNTDFNDAERFCADHPEHQQYLSQIEVL